MAEPLPNDGSGSESSESEDEEYEMPIDGVPESEDESMDSESEPDEEAGFEQEQEDEAGSEQEDEDEAEPIEEFNEGNEFLEAQPPFNMILDALGFQIWNSLYIILENRYMEGIEFDPVGVLGDDVNIGYNDEIKRNLSRVAHYLTVRRKHRMFRFAAHEYGVGVPDIIAEFGFSTEILADDSVDVQALIANLAIQIRTPPELDVALFLIDSNDHPDNLPVFYLPSQPIHDILNRKANGWFRCRIRNDLVWGDMVIGGVDPVAAPPPPAAPHAAVAPPPPPPPPAAPPAAVAPPPPPAAAPPPPPANGHPPAVNGHPPANGHLHP